MAKISNKIKCELMNRMFQSKDICDFVKQYNISDRTIENCLLELKKITNKDYVELSNDCNALSSEELINEKNRFKKYSWQIIQKANQILIDKLNQLSLREKEIDRLLEKVENCLDVETYDKTQMGKVIKLLENAKQNNISELARVIQIIYDRQNEDAIENQTTESLEFMLENLVGENF